MFATWPTTRTVPHHQNGCAPQQIQVTDVRFGSLADIEARQSDVRFTSKSGHRWPNGDVRDVPKADIKAHSSHLISAFGEN